MSNRDPSCTCIIHERTSRIFALHRGRFTIALRLDFSSQRIDLCFSRPLRGKTLDGPVNLTDLGPAWVLFAADSENEAAQAFLEAYNLAGEE